MARKSRVTNTVRTHRFNADQMTQAELAARCDVTRQTIIAIEQGRFTPSLETAFKIARTFNVTVDEVFEYLND